MAELTGSEILAKALKKEGTENLFFLMGGPMLFLGGSTALRPLGTGTQVGDLSGLVASRLPWGFRGRYSPGPECAAIPASIRSAFAGWAVSIWCLTMWR